MRGSVLLIAVIASFSLAGRSIGVPVTQTRITANAGNQSQDTTSSHVQLANLQDSFVDDLTSSAAHADALIIPGAVFADFSAIGASNSPAEHAGFAAQANVTLWGQADIHQLQSLPPGVSSFLPISILAGGSGSLSGNLDKATNSWAEGDASFDLLFNNQFTQHIGDASFRADLSTTSAGFVQRFNVSSSLLTSGTLTIQARLHIEGSAEVDVVNDTGSMGGQCFVDPLFSFDQAAYDAFAARNHLPTIHLTDYYGFNFSEALVAKPGDANSDGVVNFTDLLILAQNYGKSGGASLFQGDFNDDGSVGFDDLLTPAQHYGEGPAGAASAVPEPTCAAALGLGSLVAARRRRYHKSSSSPSAAAQRWDHVHSPWL